MAAGDQVPVSWPGNHAEDLLCSPRWTTGFPRQEYFLFQAIFPSQGLNPGLPRCRQILNHLSYQGSDNGGRELQKEEEGEDERRKKAERKEVGRGGGWGSRN